MRAAKVSQMIVGGVEKQASRFYSGLAKPCWELQVIGEIGES